MADIAVLPTSKTQGDQFERTHVRKIYDEIATSVNDIEHKAWPKVKRFLKKFETGSLIADIGMLISLLNCIPNDRILDWSKFKAFSDDKINVTEILISVLGSMESIVEKRRKCWLPAIFSSTGRRPASLCHGLLSAMCPCVRPCVRPCLHACLQIAKSPCI